jgi:lantibiotic biosynthesis protein
MHTPSALKLQPWRPLLNEDRGQAVLASIREIEDTLVSYLKGGELAATSNVQLAEGAAGIALFFAYLQAAGLAATRELAFDSLAPGIDALTTQPMNASLFSGFTGIAWTVQHVTTLLGECSDDLGCEIDRALEIYLTHSPWTHDYDLLKGLVGLGVYCVERTHLAVAVRCLELIVERLSELGKPCHDGLRWLTNPNLILPQLRANYPQGCYNLGLAHGVPGIIALLGKIHTAGIAREKAGRLLEGAVQWLLQQRLPHGSRSCFASILVPGGQPESCRLAWCYGDTGVASALLRAARCLGEKSWEREALAIARHAATRSNQNSGVVDACFCHGSSGLAHIFNRLYQATHEEVFFTASHYWIERTLQFSKPGEGAAGYRTISADGSGSREFQTMYGILVGIAGIGLSLLASSSAVEPCWDRIFLLDIPPLSPS